ncbi:MAG: hypothetical protein NZM26_02085 [Patescibacteria group bacterium]|nr:hypothetical protein [Patescibacteria group bacterium]
MCECGNRYCVVENKITKINYSDLTKNLLCILTFSSLALYLKFFEASDDTRHLLPAFMQGKLLDIMAGPFYASISKAILKSKDKTSFSLGFIAPSLIECLQGSGILPNTTFDPSDFVAYFAGACLWLIFEKMAKYLHDSGTTLPVYRCLGIRHMEYD